MEFLQEWGHRWFKKVDYITAVICYEQDKFTVFITPEYMYCRVLVRCNSSETVADFTAPTVDRGKRYAIKKINQYLTKKQNEANKTTSHRGGLSVPYRSSKVLPSGKQ